MKDCKASSGSVLSNIHELLSSLVPLLALILHGLSDTFSQALNFQPSPLNDTAISDLKKKMEKAERVATLLKHLEKGPLLKGAGRQRDVSNEKERKKYGFDLYEMKLFTKQIL